MTIEIILVIIYLTNVKYGWNNRKLVIILEEKGKMKIIDRKKMTEEIISRVKSVPVGVDWRIIRSRRQISRSADEQPSRLDHKTSMAASL